jgi:hypothetical protein
MMASDHMFMGSSEMLNDKADFMKLMRTVEKRSAALTKKAVLATYKRTQAELKKSGIEHLHLYRGAILKDIGAVQKWQAGDQVAVEMNALSSWSASGNIAASFGAQSSKGYSQNWNAGFVFETVVPASRVYAMPTTGHGCLEEWEVVILGSHPEDAVHVNTTYRQNRSSMKSV